MTSQCSSLTYSVPKSQPKYIATGKEQNAYSLFIPTKVVDEVSPFLLTKLSFLNLGLIDAGSVVGEDALAFGEETGIRRCFVAA